MEHLLVGHRCQQDRVLQLLPQQTAAGMATAQVTQHARQAMQAGAAGVIASNHGGRVLDSQLPAVKMLPAIRQAVGGEALLLVDGGIRRGTDVLKAMALGADAVLIGRPYVHALATAGALGVAHLLKLLREELEVGMALCGCRELADITPELLVRL